MFNNLCFYFVLFLIYSFIGWLMEISFTLYKDKTLVNRGFLMGPYCPIYGCGCILIILLLKRYLNDFIALFIMSMVICSILEYLTSYIMEKLFKARWWDYSDRRFNINGRICLRTMIPFGLLGLFIMYVSNPFFFSIIEKIPGNILNIICIVLMLIFLVDNIISFKIISNVNITSKKIKDNTEEITGEIAEEITEKVKAILEKKSALHRRLVHAFPEMKMRIREKIKNKIN